MYSFFSGKVNNILLTDVILEEVILEAEGQWAEKKETLFFLFILFLSVWLQFCNPVFVSPLLSFLREKKYTQGTRGVLIQVSLIFKWGVGRVYAYKPCCELVTGGIQSACLQNNFRWECSCFLLPKLPLMETN